MYKEALLPCLLGFAHPSLHPFLLTAAAGPRINMQAERYSDGPAQGYITLGSSRRSVCDRASGARSVHARRLRSG